DRDPGRVHAHLPRAIRHRYGLDGAPARATASRRRRSSRRAYGRVPLSEDQMRSPRHSLRRSLSFALMLAAASLTACSKSDSGAAARRGPITPVDPSTAGSIHVDVAFSGSPLTPGTINMSGTA